MQTRRSTRHAQIRVLSNKPPDIRIVITRPKINQPGIFIMLLPSKNLPVYRVADLLVDGAPGVEFIGDLAGAAVVGEIDGGAEAVVVRTGVNPWRKR